MFDLTLAINLVLHSFAFKNGSPRFPTPRRLLHVFITLPLFLLLILVNRFFMLLDHVIFPGFRKMKMNNVVFITGIPRSATTFLYNLLAKDQQNFTCFKLWEILVAPSITQKVIFSWIFKFDELIGRRLYRISGFCDRMFLARIARLHDISLSKPEEDEMLLIYAFVSVYLVYFFPDVTALDSHLFFDEEISNQKRKKIMLFYKACIQRHVYFYDRYEEKTFLSKNPSFISKTTSLAEAFQNARLIYMLRSPLKTIPSTISLNRNIYSVFSGELKVNPLASQTRESIIRWYQMVNRSMSTHWQDRSITIPFKKITRSPAQTVLNIYLFLKLIPAKNMNKLLETEQENSGSYASTHDYKCGEVDDHLVRQLEFIFQGPFYDDI